MLIKPTNFDNDGEVDFTAHYRDGAKQGRAAMRKQKQGDRYEIYVHWFFPKKKDEVLHRGNLRECVSFSNARFGLDDMVGD